MSSIFNRYLGKEHHLGVVAVGFSGGQVRLPRSPPPLVVLTPLGQIRRRRRTASPNRRGAFDGTARRPLVHDPPRRGRALVHRIHALLRPATARSGGQQAHAATRHSFQRDAGVVHASVRARAGGEASAHARWGPQHCGWKHQRDCEGGSGAAREGDRRDMG